MSLKTLGMNRGKIVVDTYQADKELDQENVLVVIEISPGSRRVITRIREAAQRIINLKQVAFCDLTLQNFIFSSTADIGTLVRKLEELFADIGLKFDQF